ncbi:response regulator [Motilimonas eburnea]|uniref:response regulator n=1 Tax=Motilimonas eburnea TaxID=1737488 RepID=UPI001E391893|nr:response regulator [Motilimonas eburnea]MCE2573327.1 response regulator [Motilimonas eburnea]
MNLTIGKKIAAAFGSILAMVVVMGGVIYYLNSNIYSASRYIQTDDVPGAILYLQLLDEMGDMDRNVAEYMNGEERRRDGFKYNFHEFTGFLAELKPLESDTEENRNQMATVERLINQYVKEVNQQVFEKYQPENERWAIQTVEELQRKQGSQLEQLLDSLKEQEIAEALQSTSIEQTVQDDLPGVRYYLELIDAAGDMLAALHDYVAGESGKESDFASYAKDFTHYFDLLEPLEQRPAEIRELVTINGYYTDIVNTAEKVFAQYRPENKKHALVVLDELESTILNELEALIDRSALEEQADANLALDTLANTLSQVNFTIISLTMAVLIFGVAISYWITSSILRSVGGEPRVIEGLANEVAAGNVDMAFDDEGKVSYGIYDALKKMIMALKIKINATEKIAEGDLNAEIQLASDKDKLGVALNKMQLNFKGMVEKANAFAMGDYASQITPRSKQDELGIALSHMMQQVTDRNEQVEAQNWLKSQVVKIGSLAQGANDVVALAQAVIAELATILQAGHGVFYLRDENAKEQDEYRLLASYAYVERKNVANRFMLGEGIVGQCALERNTIILTNVPDDYIKVSSGLGQEKPNTIIALPVVFEDKCLGVIELASFSRFSELQLEFLHQTMINLGVTINSLMGRKRIVELLQQSQSQTEELQSQTEELQSQSEELRATNEELEQKAQLLNQQSSELKGANADLEQKTQALEVKQRDIEIKNQQIEEKAKELATASKYKSEFLANMSHELRTPLNSLLLLAKGLAKNKHGNLTPVQVEDAKVIFDGGNSLLTLINDIMDLSKVEAGKLTIHSEEIMLSHLTSNLERMFKPVAQERNLAFVIDIESGLPTRFCSDNLRVEQILRNLLSNAMKFTPHGEVKLSIHRADANTHFLHSDMKVEDCIAFSVIDTGIGIPEAKQNAIFEAFQQEDGTTSRKYGGTGLGLTIARELSRLLGGEIHLKSEQGNGSTFTLYLPALTTPIPAEQSASLAAATPESPSSTSQWFSDDRHIITADDKCLLIVENDNELIMSIQATANQNQYKCIITHSALSVLQLAIEYQPVGIILDADLEELNARQVISQLKTNPQSRHIPVQVIASQDKDKLSLLAIGAIGFDSKPVSNDQLVAMFAHMARVSGSSMRNVLLIEDDKSNQKATAQLLESENLKIDTASTGGDGLKRMQQNQYDAVILDLGLPDMSGFELLNQLGESGSGNITPIIIYTGREISKEEQKQLDQYSSSIVLKGADSAERLEDDLKLFLHQAETDKEAEISLLHNEAELLEGRKVLLVDDDMRNSYALSKMLIEIGVNVELAENGQEAINLLEQVTDFELILMDTMMPVMDGNKATELIRQMEHYKKVPIIALTAKTMPEDKEKSLASGASEYLTKPVDFDNLVSIMRIWLYDKAHGGH